MTLLNPTNIMTKKRKVRYNYIDWCKGTCNRNIHVSSKGFCKQCTEAGEFGG